MLGKEKSKTKIIDTQTDKGDNSISEENVILYPSKENIHSQPINNIRTYVGNWKQEIPILVRTYVATFISMMYFSVRT